MRLFVLALVGALWMAAPCSAQNRTAGEMVLACESADPSLIAECRGYMRGVWDTLEMLSTDAGVDLVCPAITPTLREAVQVFASYVRAHDETRSTSASRAALRAFIAAWPCPRASDEPRVY